MSDLENSSAWQVSRCQSVKVKLVKVMYTGLKNEFDFFDFDQETALQRYSVTALQCYSSEWALRVAALQLKTKAVI